MKFEIDFERTFPHPVEKVWQALIDREALGEWLMETDFVPEQGRHFTMWCDDGRGGTDTYLCRVLEYDPPRHMLWSWLLQGNEDQGETFVEFSLEPVEAGSKLTIIHHGDRDKDVVDRFKSGWPAKLDDLTALLRSINGSAETG